MQERHNSCKCVIQDFPNEHDEKVESPQTNEEHQRDQDCAVRGSKAMEVGDLCDSAHARGESSTSVRRPPGPPTPTDLPHCIARQVSPTTVQPRVKLKF